MISKTHLIIRYIIVIIAVLLGLYSLSLHSFLLFHSIVELITIVVALGVFIFAWNSRRYIHNNFLIFIGIAFLFIASIDFAHTLAYEGMGIFVGSANRATQLWIAARYMQALSFLIAPFLLNRKIKFEYVFVVYTGITILIFISIFAISIFPTAYMDGVGLTPFKIISEYIISTMLLGSIFFLYWKRKNFSTRVYSLLIFSIILNILAEISFTQYVSVFGFANILGHFLKLGAFILIYLATIRMGFTRPNEILFKNLVEREEQLEKSRANLQSLYSSMTEGLATHEIVYNSGKPVDYIITDVNPAYERITGISKDDAVGAKASVLYKTKKPPYFDTYLRVAFTGMPKSFESFFAPMHKHFSISAFSPQRGVFATIFSDITAYKKAEEALNKLNKGLAKNAAELEKSNNELKESQQAALNMMEDVIMARDALKESEAKYRELVDNSLIGVYKSNVQGDYLFVNNALSKMFGFSSPAEMLKGKVPTRYYNPNRREEFLKQLKKKKKITNFQNRMLTKDGKVKHVLVSAKLNGQEISGMIMDITKRIEIEDRIKESLQEKEMLLKEIHHRIKNNLQLVYSMLRMQTMYVDENTTKQITDAQARIRSMALLHELLYTSSNFSEVNARQYFDKLIKETYITYANADTIDIDWKISDFLIDSNRAIYMGLLMTELLTNSIKHAFPDNTGRIAITVEEIAKSIVMVVQDNGKGILKKNKKSLGYHLIESFIEQLEGKYELLPGKGAKIKITVPK